MFKAGERRTEQLFPDNDRKQQRLWLKNHALDAESAVLTAGFGFPHYDIPTPTDLPTRIPLPDYSPALECEQLPEHCGNPPFTAAWYALTSLNSLFPSTWEQKTASSQESNHVTGGQSEANKVPSSILKLSPSDSNHAVTC